MATTARLSDLNSTVIEDLTLNRASTYLLAESDNITKKLPLSDLFYAVSISDVQQNRINASGVILIDLSYGNLINLTLAGDCHLELATPITAFPTSFKIRVKQTSTTMYGLTYSSVFKTINGAGYDLKSICSLQNDVVWFYAQSIELGSVELFMTSGPLR